jgi:hypothetical protein
VKVENRVTDTQKQFEQTLLWYKTETRGWEKPILQRLDENQSYYSGTGQWDDDDKQVAKEEKRFTPVINQVAPSVHLVSGHERQNRTSVKPYAFETSDNNIAFIMEYVLKHVGRSNKTQFCNSHGFLRSLITSEAHWEYSIDIEDDGMLAIRREQLKTGRVMWDPNSVEYDRSDARRCFHIEWISEKDALELYPELKDEPLDYGDGASEDGAATRAARTAEHMDSYKFGDMGEKNSNYYDGEDENRQVRFIG